MNTVFLKPLLTGFMLCLLVCFSGYASSEKNNTNHYLNIQTWTTNNNVEVYFIHQDTLPIVDIDVIFKAGSAYDGNKFGLSSITSTMIGTSTKKAGENEIIDAVNNLGVELSTNSTRDHLTFSLRSLSDSSILTEAVGILNDVLSGSIFKQSIFDRTKDQYITDIQMDQQYPDSVAYKTFYRTLYKNHPYGHPVDGTEDSIKSIHLNDIKQFYDTYIVKPNATITIIGNLSRKQAKALAQDIETHIHSGRPAKPIPKPQPLTSDRTVKIDFDSQQTTILKGTLGIAEGDPDFFPLKVGNQFLGGKDFNALLFTEVRRKRGLAYGAYSHLRQYKRKGTFIISTKTRNEKAAQTLKVINQTVQIFLEKGLNKDEINTIKQYIYGNLPLSFDSNQNKSSMLNKIAFYDLPLDYYQTYMAHIQQVTNDQVMKQFHQLLKSQSQLTVIVGPDPSSSVSAP